MADNPVPVTIPEPVIERVKLSKLKPWTKNPRKNHAFEAIAESIKEFGYLSPIIVQKGTYRILAGHGRLGALKKSGIHEAPVIVADIDDAAADAFTITDNKTGLVSDWDFQTLAEILKTLSTKFDFTKMGWSDFELSPILAADWRASGTGSLEDFQRKGTKTFHLEPPQLEVVERALATAKEKLHQPNLTESEAIVEVCRYFNEKA